MQACKPLVLVVEDNPDTAKFTAAPLRAWGYSPVTAATAAAALQALQERVPDVILLDLGLPDMDGYQLAAKIRERWPYKPPLLVAVTGYGNTEDRNRSNLAGIDLHLLKPVDPEELHYLLSQCRVKADKSP